jgi:hypothetical protein
MRKGSERGTCNLADKRKMFYIHTHIIIIALFGNEDVKGQFLSRKSFVISKEVGCMRKINHAVVVKQKEYRKIPVHS